MKRHSLAALVLTALVCAPAAPSLAADDTTPYHVGETMRSIDPTVARNWRGAQTQALITRIWFPVDASLPATSHEIGAPGESIFRGYPVVSDAPLSPAHKTYPLLLLSHGTGGSADSLDWLGASLAAHGYIVAGVNHPGNNAMEPYTREGFVLWWERATDVSEVLDSLLADPVLGTRIDADRIGAVGFSLGGYTVLELAGARTDMQAFLDFCKSPAADAICHPPEMDRLNHADMSAGFSEEALASMARSGASYRDKRIKAVFAIAPALGEAFNRASFADVDIPVSLMAGASDTIAPVQTNIRRTAGFLPNAEVLMVPDAGHNTFLDTCLPAVVQSRPAICVDGAGVDRDAVHAQAVERALGFFAKTLPVKPQ